MKKRGVTLYNLIFPIWLLWLIPMTWIVVLPANFIIDLLVVVITMKFLKVEEIKKNAKMIILRVYLFGFVADIIGTLVMFTANLISFSYETPMGKWWYHNISNAVSYYPFETIYSFLWVTVSVIITGILIYFFNYKFALKKVALDNRIKKKIALSLAIFTAPYLFYLPTSWFF